MDLSTSLKEAKDFLRKEYHKGVDCPCCGQFVKMYERPITSAMAYALILFSKTNGYVHADSFFKEQDCPPSIKGDFPKLSYWGLIHRHNKDIGFYSMTFSGDMFVKNQINVPSHIKLYNDKCYGYADKAKPVRIKDCLKKKFNYEELMNNVL